MTVELEGTAHGLGKWMSVALDDPNVCAEMKADIQAWFAAGQPTALEAALARVEELEQKLNTPELYDFTAAVVQEAAHQRTRWPSQHDAGKRPEDWFWLVGYLGGKALRAAMMDETPLALHHTISTAGALANWHAALLGVSTDMRPGIMPPDEQGAPTT